VASFIGEINLIEGAVVGGRFEAAGHALPSPGGPSGPATLAIRPEKGRLGPSKDAALEGTIIEASFLGAMVRYIVEAADGTRHMAEEAVEGRTMRDPGAAVGLSWRAEDAMILPREPS
jgi:ABC-type Fe3+/spermidine/putrescine transport system ATPase subunit